MMEKKEGSDVHGVDTPSFADKIGSMMVDKGGGDGHKFLKGKKGLILGIANERSIAYGCGKVFHALPVC